MSAEKIIRKKNTGEIGNGGEFGTKHHDEAGTGLAPAPRSVDQIAIDAIKKFQADKRDGLDPAMHDTIVNAIREAQSQPPKRPTRGGTPAYFASNIDVLSPSDYSAHGSEADDKTELLVWEGEPGDTDASFVLAVSPKETCTLIQELYGTLPKQMQRDLSQQMFIPAAHLG